MNLKNGIIGIFLTVTFLMLIAPVNAQPWPTATWYYEPLEYVGNPTPHDLAYTTANHLYNVYVYTGVDTQWGNYIQEYHADDKGYLWGNGWLATIGTNNASANYTCMVPSGGSEATSSCFWNKAAAKTWYPNVTINVKSNVTNLDIPRVDITVHNTATSSLSGKTDLNGNITFGYLGLTDQFSPYFIASKAGYNTTNITMTGDFNQTDLYYQVKLDDGIYPGAPATVFLDIADASTGAAISGAIVGIQNLSAPVNQWRYATFSQSTIQFNTTDISPEINLSVGQGVIFSAYKSGVYTANNTGLYIIPSAVSHLTLLLSSVSTTPQYYYYPVTISDATTGNALSYSWLNVDGSNTGWYNRSSSTGKFNITGKGTTGSISLVSGDTMSIFGNATGYIDGGFYLIVSNQSNGVTQYVNLVPNSYNPIAGEFTAVFLTYDSTTSDPLYGVSISVVNNGNTTTKMTGISGSVVFTNLTSANSHQYTAIKSGYTTMTNNIVGSSGTIVYQDVPMSPGNVNPTPSTTTYVVPTATISNIPTTSTTGPAGNYTGFWGPFYNLFSAMGAENTGLNLLLAALIVMIGALFGLCAPGFISGGGFSAPGGLIGGVFGFLMATMFGFINPLYLILLIIFGVFLYFFFGR